MSRSDKPTGAFTFSLIAGILILGNSTLLGAATTWFLWVIPTLPESAANDTTLLYVLTAVGLICGVLVLLGAIMLHTKPEDKKTWGLIVIVSSIPSVLTGGGFIIGFVLGVIDGAKALSKKNKNARNKASNDYTINAILSDPQVESTQIDLRRAVFSMF